jgi:glucokinase
VSDVGDPMPPANHLRKRVLGLDLGGTYIKTAVVETSAGTAPEVIYTNQGPTDAADGPEAVITRLIRLGGEAIDQTGPVDGAGVGVPGLFDFDTGEVIFFTNLPGSWEGVPLRSRLAEGLGVTVNLINDARAFTLAEGTVGAGQGARTLACLTLGTGIGGGLMIDGKLEFGAFGIAGELGHQTVDPDGEVCGCGNRGCLEAVARPPVIAAAAGKQSFEEVLRGLADGDRRSVEALAAASHYLGIGLANVITMIGPDRIVIGGGVAEAGDIVFEPVRDAVRSRLTLVPPEVIQIVPANLGAEAGAIGAALSAIGSPVGNIEFLKGDIPSAQMRRSTKAGSVGN